MVRLESDIIVCKFMYYEYQISGVSVGVPMGVSVGVSMSMSVGVAMGVSVGVAASVTCGY